uniref:ATP synthase subunit epsilon, mitochondrial n=1 Tax=Tetranychus urticae TaxID=32264 RepID=T1KZ53_TETUR
MTFWREAGLNYIQYSRIAARIVRQSLKKDVKITDKEGRGPKGCNVIEYIAEQLGFQM